MTVFLALWWAIPAVVTVLGVAVAYRFDCQMKEEGARDNTGAAMTAALLGWALILWGRYAP